MPRDPIPTWFFAVVVVRKDDQYLIVQESKQGQPWYLPAGRVEPGETLIRAAVRETLEETGVPVKITGLLRIEHTPRHDGSRVRVVYLAEPVDDAEPKSVPDEESLAAKWVRVDELDRYPLRGDEVRQMIEYVQAGGPAYPIDLILPEGVPFSVFK